MPIPVLIRGEEFLAPSFLLGEIDKNAPWGRGLEQQSFFFTRQVMDHFGVSRDEAELLIGEMVPLER